MIRPLLECRGVTKRFGDVVAVDGVDLQLMPGEVLSILGASGCGKTTLLRLIAGFEALDDGQISHSAGTSLSDARQHLPPERRNIGMVFQEYALFPHLTVAQNVAFGLHGMSGDEQRHRTRRRAGACQIDRSWMSATRTNSPEVSSSVSRLREHWRRLRLQCCWTSRSATWMPGCARTSAMRWKRF